MKINSLKLQNFRCFEDITVELNPTLNVIIGNNGVGKTTVLDALAVGIGSFFLGIESCSSPNIKKTDVRFVSNKLGSVIDRQPQYPAVISCSGKIGDEEITWTRNLNTEAGKKTYGGVNIKNIAAELQNKIRKGDASVDLPLISYYGTGRLWAQLRESSTKQIDNRFAGYIDCLSAESNERLMLKWFEKMTYIQLQNNEPIPELQAVNNAIVECYNESGVKANDIKAAFNVKSHRLEISYTDENNNSQIHPFHELSDGYRNTLCLVADIAYRMAILNPQYLGDVTKHTSGIVLIDEVDLHLHPIWQKNILKTLQKIFPLVQFIVTTHSPNVISSTKAENLLILDGHSCKSFDYEVYGKDVNSVLHEVMNTSERPEEVNRMFKKFEDHMDKGDYILAEETLNELRKLVGENDSGVVSAAVALDFEKDWGENV